MISGCIITDEQTISLEKLKKTAARLLNKSSVKLHLNRKFIKSDTLDHDFFVNATYSNINLTNKILNIPAKKFRYDICNVPIVKLPNVLSGIGITIMDGPFHSILPYAGTPYHLFWSVEQSAARSISKFPPDKTISKIANYKDHTYIPLLKEAKLIDVLKTTKILRPDVELSDERVSDLVESDESKYVILSAKLNTCVLTARRLASVVRLQAYTN